MKNKKDLFFSLFKLSCLMILLYWSLTWNTPESIGNTHDSQVNNYEKQLFNQKYKIKAMEKQLEISISSDRKENALKSEASLKNGQKEDPVIDTFVMQATNVIPSFDEWKRMMLNEHDALKQKNSASKIPGKTAANRKHKLNYASSECGAKIIASNADAKGTKRILNEHIDDYMLNPCQTKIWFVIELCDSIQTSQIQLANFELYSSSPKKFAVFSSNIYPNQKWMHLGTFEAEDQRTLQSFDFQHREFGKFIKVELYSHYGREHYCPLSIVKIFGASMVDEYEDLEVANHISQSGEDSYDVYLNISSSENSSLAADEIDNGIHPVFEPDESKQNIADPSLKFQKFAYKPQKPVGHFAGINSKLYEVFLHRCQHLKSKKTVHCDVKHPSCNFFHLVLGEHVINTIYDSYCFEHNVHGEAMEIYSARGIPAHNAFLQDKTKKTSSNNIKETISFKANVEEMAVNTDIQHNAKVSKNTHLKNVDTSSVFQTEISNKYLLGVTDSSLTVPKNVELTNRDRNIKMPEIKKGNYYERLLSFGVFTHELVHDDTVKNVIVPMQHDIPEGKNGNSDTSRKKEHIINPSDTKISALFPNHGKKGTNIMPMEIPFKSSDSYSIILDKKLWAEADRCRENCKENDPLKARLIKEQQLTEVSSTLYDHANISSTHMQENKDFVLQNQVAESSTLNQKESVLMKLTSRIKILELNMNLSSQYLQELSQWYRHQMDEMQHIFNATAEALTVTSEKAEKVDAQQQIMLDELQKNLTSLKQTLDSLLIGRTQFRRQLIKMHVFLLVVEIIFVAVTYTLCFHNLKIYHQSYIFMNHLSKYKKKVSANDIIVHSSLKLEQEQRTSENHKLSSSYPNLMIVEPTIPMFLSKPRKKQRKRKRKLIRRASSTMLSELTGTKEIINHCATDEHSVNAGLLFIQSLSCKPQNLTIH